MARAGFRVVAAAALAALLLAGTAAATNGERWATHARGVGALKQSICIDDTALPRFPHAVQMPHRPW